MEVLMVDQQSIGGILIRDANDMYFASAQQRFIDRAMQLGIEEFIDASEVRDGEFIRFRISSDLLNHWMPDGETLLLCDRLQLKPLLRDTDLEREILLTMLLSPVAFEYPSYSEFAASVRIRQNIVKASCRTALAFHTSKIERPEDYWTYTEENGFTVLPGKSLIEALIKATQPEVSGQLYSFSCYRATEYVILLGIAQELVQSNPVLLQQLQRQWESRAIKSRQFHDVFMREYGSMNEPLPAKYYVPGDRLWFRNPDERSAQIDGYEGSWVFYLGRGLFSNFWQRDKPFTLASKCIEIYHWRFGVYQNADGNLQMDEAVVEECVNNALSNPVEVEGILDCMMRLRDPQGVLATGGCIDASREYSRWICPGTSDLVLPEKEYAINAYE
jgi:hypothetical protein